MHSGVHPADSGIRRRLETQVRRIYVDADTLPDPGVEPVHIDRVAPEAILITGHTGLLACDLIPHIVAMLDDHELRIWLDAYGATNISTAHVRHDWMSALQEWLWIPTCRATLPEHLRWR